MAAPFDTLALDAGWDLFADVSGNIATLSPPSTENNGTIDSIAQDATSAARLFQGELYYDTTQGVPYFSKILGKRPPLSLLKSYFVTAALTVPYTQSAKCFITAVSERKTSGQIQIIDQSGNLSVANF